MPQNLNFRDNAQNGATPSDSEQGKIVSSWVQSSFGSQLGQIKFYATDYSSAREGFRITTSGSAPQVSFFGATAVGQQTGGSKSATTTWGANEQTMVSNMWSALRAYGLLS